MVRLDRQRLENAVYPAKVEIPTRFDDLDVQGHVNNVAVAVLLQEARGRFNRHHIAQYLGPGRAMVVGRLCIEYAEPMHYPAPVEIETGVLEIGRSTYVLGQLARQEGRVAALAEVTLVLTQNKRATPITDEIRQILTNAMLA